MYQKPNLRLALTVIVLPALAALAGPVASASADCSTLTSCVVENAQNVAAQAQQAVQTEVAYVQQEQACLEAQASNPDPLRGDQVCQTAGSALKAGQNAVGQVGQIAQQASSDVQRRTSSQSLSCVVQGRWYSSGSPVPSYAQGIVQSPGSASGVVNCIRHNGTNAASDGAPAGTFTLTGLLLYCWDPFNCTLSGPYSGPQPTAGALSLGSDTYTLWTVNNGQGVLNADIMMGTWSAPGGAPRHQLLGALHLLRASTVDPSGGADYFVNGELTLVGALDPT
jgi:hypothetical protein